MTIREIDYVRVGDPGWLQSLRDELRGIRNFVLVAPSVEKLSEIFREETNQEGYVPELLNRWGIYALNDVVPARYQMQLLQYREQGEAVAIVEQLRLPLKAPPHLKSVIVYCESRGIVSQHDDVDAARESFDDYRGLYARSNRFPLGGVYVWRARWEKIE